MKVNDLAISKKTKEFLYSLGYTDIGMFVDKDDFLFANKLPKKNFVELAGEIAKIKAEFFWNCIQEAKNGRCST